MMTFAEFGLVRKIISDAGKTLLRNIQTILKKLNIQQSITSSYHYQSNGQVEAFITFMKCTIQKCIGTNQDVNLALLQI